MGIGAVLAGVRAHGVLASQLAGPGIWVRVVRRPGSRDDVPDPMMFMSLLRTDRGQEVSWGPSVIAMGGTEIALEIAAGGWAGFIARAHVENLAGSVTERVATYHGTCHPDQADYWHRTTIDSYDDNLGGSQRKAILLLDPDQFARTKPGENAQDHQFIGVTAAPILKFSRTGSEQVTSVTKAPPPNWDQLPPTEQSEPAAAGIMGVSSAGIAGSEADVSLTVRRAAAAAGKTLGTNTGVYDFSIAEEGGSVKLRFRIFSATRDEMVAALAASHWEAGDQGLE